MKAVMEKEVPKVVQAIRQTTSRKVLSKLLTRIKVRCKLHLSSRIKGLIQHCAHIRLRKIKRLCVK